MIAQHDGFLIALVKLLTHFCDISHISGVAEVFGPLVVSEWDLSGALVVVLARSANRLAKSANRGEQPAQATCACRRKTAGGVPTHRLKARLKVACSENPVRNATSAIEHALPEKSSSASPFCTCCTTP